MKNHIALLVSLLILFSCEKKESKIGELYRITFEEGFKKDKVSLYINSLPIFKEKIIETNLTYGATGTQFICEKTKSINKGYLYGKPFKIDEKLIDDKLFLEVFLNGKKKIFNVDLKKGRYLGFNIEKEKLKFVQTIEPNFYD